jgi:hypothetical protein
MSLADTNVDAVDHRSRRRRQRRHPDRSRRHRQAHPQALRPINFAGCRDHLSSPTSMTSGTIPPYLDDGRELLVAVFRGDALGQHGSIPQARGSWRISQWPTLCLAHLQRGARPRQRAVPADPPVEAMRLKPLSVRVARRGPWCLRMRVAVGVRGRCRTPLGRARVDWPDD